MTHRYRSLDFFLRRKKLYLTASSSSSLLLLWGVGRVESDFVVVVVVVMVCESKTLTLYQHPYTKIKLSLTAAFALSLDSRPLVKMFESVSSKQWDCISWSYFDVVTTYRTPMSYPPPPPPPEEKECFAPNLCNMPLLPTKQVFVLCNQNWWYFFLKKSLEWKVSFCSCLKCLSKLGGRMGVGEEQFGDYVT